MIVLKDGEIIAKKLTVPDAKELLTRHIGKVQIYTTHSHNLLREVTVNSNGDTEIASYIRGERHEGSSICWNLGELLYLTIDIEKKMWFRFEEKGNWRVGPLTYNEHGCRFNCDPCLERCEFYREIDGGMV